MALRSLFAKSSGNARYQLRPPRSFRPIALLLSYGRPPSSFTAPFVFATLDILVSMIRNVAAFCASASGANPAYRAAAEELGRALAIRNIGLIYGGSNVGLMKAVAEAALTADGKVKIGRAHV